MHHPCRRLHEIASRQSATNFVTCSKCLTDMRSERNTQRTKQPELRLRALLTEDGIRHIELASAYIGQRTEPRVPSRSTVEQLTRDEQG
jgi:hypothetical protein